MPNPDASLYSSHTKPAHYSRHSRRFPTNTTGPHLIKMGRRTGVVFASMSSGRAQNTKLVRHNEATRHVQRARGRRRLWSQPARALPERNTGLQHCTRCKDTEPTANYLAHSRGQNYVQFPHPRDNFKSDLSFFFGLAEYPEFSLNGSFVGTFP